MERDPLARRLEAVAEQPEQREDDGPDQEPGHAADHVTGEGSSEHENHGAERVIAAPPQEMTRSYGLD